MCSSVRISVITATWNSVFTLSDCLDSMAQQNYPHKEHVIVDGLSTDGTVDVINQYADQIDIFRSEPDTGIYDALNKGIQLATGDVIGFLHADDIYASSEVLSTIAKAFEGPDICAVYGNLEYVSRGNIHKVIRHWRSKAFVSEDLGRGWMPPHPTLYVRREWYLKIGGFDTTYRIAADYLSVLRLFSDSKFKTVYIPNVLVTMRLGGASNKSIKALFKKMKEDWRALRSCDFSFMRALRAIFWKNVSKVSQFNAVIHQKAHEKFNG
jgi:glycosyltransferase involved in cell wall biosynthesis